MGGSGRTVFQIAETISQEEVLCFVMTFVIARAWLDEHIKEQERERAIRKVH
jgi:hypothetical protein